MTPEEVDEVLLDDSIPTAYSESSGRPGKFGYTSTGKHIIVIWDEIDEDPLTIYPATAYEVPPSLEIIPGSGGIILANREISPAAIAAARKRANALRKKITEEKGVALTPKEQDDAAPFYFMLRAFIQQLKEAREAAGLTLADVSQQTGMAVESLSRLETGAQTNPTWKTLGLYAKAVGRQPYLVARTGDRDKHQADEALRQRAGRSTS